MSVTPLHEKHKPAFFTWWSDEEVMTWFTVGERGDCTGSCETLLLDT